MCDKRVLDIFVTKDNENYSSDGLDEECKGYVWSVDVKEVDFQLSPYNTEVLHWTAFISNWKTNWIMSHVRLPRAYT